MPNTNLQVIKFTNERLRPMMDRLYSAWMQAVEVNQDYVSGGIGALITAAGSTETIADGSATDGRNVITGDDVLNAITAMNAYVSMVTGAAVSTLDRKDVITKPHVNRN